MLYIRARSSSKIFKGGQGIGWYLGVYTRALLLLLIGVTIVQSQFVYHYFI